MTSCPVKKGVVCPAPAGRGKLRWSVAASPVTAIFVFDPAAARSASVSIPSWISTFPVNAVEATVRMAQPGPVLTSVVAAGRAAA